MKKITSKQCGETAMVFALLGLVLGMYFQNDNWNRFACGILLIALILPSFFRPLAYGWFGISHILGMVSSSLVLSLVYFLVITPIGLVRRWLGIDSLELNGFGNKASAYKERGKAFSKSDLDYPY